MANSLADIKQAMLKEIGAASIEELFEQIPVAHRLKSPLKLPRQLKSEAELKRHLHHHAGAQRDLREEPEFPRAPAAGSITCRRWSTRSSGAPNS